MLMYLTSKAPLRTGLAAAVACEYCQDSCEGICADTCTAYCTIACTFYCGKTVRILPP